MHIKCTIRRVFTSELPITECKYPPDNTFRAQPAANASENFYNRIYSTISTSLYNQSSNLERLINTSKAD